MNLSRSVSEPDKPGLDEGNEWVCAWDARDEVDEEEDEGGPVNGGSGERPERPTGEGEFNRESFSIAC